MSGLFGQPSTATGANTVGDLKNDVAVTTLPEDGITSLAFNPNPADQKDLMAVASWDKKVRIYEVNASGQAAPLAAYEHAGPVFSVQIMKDGINVVSGGADNQAKIMDLNQQQSRQIAQHEKPIRTVRCVEVNGQPIVITGSWDKTIKYWDMRSPTAVATKECPERIYSMDARDSMLVTATAERIITVMDIRNPGAEFYKRHPSPLKWQTRVVSCFTDATGYAIGSIEGRCAIQYVEDKDARYATKVIPLPKCVGGSLVVRDADKKHDSANFSFKCHRDPPQNNSTNVYSVNDISFHPEHGTFSTAGSDGTFHFWDKDAKHRLKGYPNVGGPITATSFNRNGRIFAYAIGYDWSKGYQANNPQQPIKLMLHPVQTDECKPRPSAKKR